MYNLIKMIRRRIIVKTLQNNHSKRIWEIDFLRGIALILMMLFHLLYDLYTFYNVNIPYWNSFWDFEGTLSAALFMILAGISSTFSKNNLIRGFRVFLVGMGLTLGTFIFMPSEYIRFGILHMLGISMILYHFIKNVPHIFYFITSSIVIFLAYLSNRMNTNTWVFIPFGITKDDFVSLDYYPLLPWFGVFLIGILIGKIIYKEKKSILQKSYRKDFLSFLGRHSLIVYLIHQPIFLLLLYIFSLIKN